MSVASMAAVGAQVDREISRVVADLLGQHGIPRTLDESLRLAELLHPEISRLRRRLYREAVLDMGRQMAALGLQARPAQLADYDVKATYSLINRAVGLARESNTLPVEILDPKTKQMVTQRIAPYLVVDPDAEVVRSVSERISSSAARHARAAGRSVIVDTARRGEVFDTRNRSRKDVGYARVLTGKENCGFCAMLASRGAVYSSDTVLRQRDGTRYHDNCDCEARLVVRGYRWEGDEEARRLYEDLWLPAVTAGKVRSKRDWVSARDFYKAWEKTSNKSDFAALKG